MNIDTVSRADVMQVCGNGHVVTERLRSDPSSGRSHCDRCGAATLDHCLTCGWQLPGAAAVPGLVPIGTWPAPRYCLMCGAAFPWVRRPPSGPDSLAFLVAMLRRVPLVIRQLRWRQTDRPVPRIEDERDLEDLLRALLPVHFDDVRLESRTPSYGQVTRTDLILAAPKIALTVKLARSSGCEHQLAQQWQEDIAYYRARTECRVLVGFVHDPMGVVRDRQTLDAVRPDDLEVHWVVGAANPE